MFRKNPPLVALEVLAKRKKPFVFQFSRRGWLGPIKTLWSDSHLIQVLPGNIHMGRKDLQICMAKSFVWKSCERGHFSGKTCIICTSHIVIYMSWKPGSSQVISKSPKTPPHLKDSPTLRFGWAASDTKCAEFVAQNPEAASKMAPRWWMWILGGVPTNGVGKLGPYDGSGRNLSMWTSCQVFWGTN